MESSNSAYQFENPAKYDMVPKTGSITEYQTNYHGLKSRGDKNKPVLNHIKDTLSFGDKRFINDPPQFGGSTESLNSSFNHLESSNNNKSVLKSKNLNRLNKMVPEKTLSWYKGDHGFYGNSSSELASGSQLPANSSNNSSTSFKNDYIRKFDEFNSGIVDSYSITKGGVYLSGNDDVHDQYNSQQQLRQQKLSAAQIAKDQTPRDYDLRSVWIPKKFEGRNMFTSHIETTMFPDKARKASPFLAEKQNNPSFEKPEKSVRYAMSNDNKIVAHMAWRPTRGMPSSATTRQGLSVKPAHRPIRSSYQDDFEDSSAAFFRANTSRPTTQGNNIPASTSIVSDQRKSKY